MCSKSAFFASQLGKKDFFVQWKEKSLTGGGRAAKMKAMRSRHRRSPACGETVG